MRLKIFNLRVLFSVSIIGLGLIGQALQAQDLTSLSNQGYGHWMTANRLAESASEVEDYLVIAKEYEQVIASDPSFEKAYFELIHVYEKIALEKGPSFLDKALTILDNYSSIYPNDSRVVESERTYIQAFREKSKRNILKGFVGKWKFMGLRIGEDGGSYTASVESTDQYKRFVSSVRVEDDHLILYVRESYDGIAYGQLKWLKDWHRYENHSHDCGGKHYSWTKEIEYQKYIIWNENGTNYIALIHHDDEYYSQDGALVHECSYTYDKSALKSVLKH